MLPCTHFTMSVFLFINQLALHIFLKTNFKGFQSVRQHSRSIPRSLSRGWILQFDGGSRGNPGLGGCGATMYLNDTKLGEMKEIWFSYSFIGKAGVTNNQAEYLGLITGLKQAVKMNIQSLIIQGDSDLVLKQVQGIYAVRQPQLKKLHDKVCELKKKIPHLVFVHIPRKLNGRADELANQAMDSMKSSSKSVVRKKQLESALTILTTETDQSADPVNTTSISSANETQTGQSISIVQIPGPSIYCPTCGSIIPSVKPSLKSKKMLQILKKHSGSHRIS